MITILDSLKKLIIRALLGQCPPLILSEMMLAIESTFLLEIRNKSHHLNICCQTTLKLEQPIEIKEEVAGRGVVQYSDSINISAYMTARARALQSLPEALKYFEDLEYQQGVFDGFLDRPAGLLHGRFREAGAPPYYLNGFRVGHEVREEILASAVLRRDGRSVAVLTPRLRDLFHSANLQLNPAL